MDQPRFLNPAKARVFCLLWIALLAFSFYLTWRYARHEAMRTEEYAYACDPFGYLRMAKEIRYGFANSAWPQFKLESPQTRTLIDFMQNKQAPVSRWDEVVAPHAHHYFPQAGSVGVQYPPGAGLALAMFPQGEAVYGLNRLVAAVFALAGIAAFGLAIRKCAWRSIGLVVLALNLGLLVLARIGPATYSINAVLPPILITSSLCVMALWLEHRGRNRLAGSCALVAGLSLGFATLVRLPAFLLLPGFLILLWPGFRRLFRLTNLPLAMTIGAVIGGVIPVLINQSHVAGAWYLSTYASVDAAAPTLERLRFNLSFFLGDGPAATDNWALLYAAAGFVGFVLFYIRREKADSDHLELSWKRVALAATALWLISLAYFLTHAITAPHYMIPAVFAAVAVIGMGAFSIDLRSNYQFKARRAVSWIALVVIFAPGVAVFTRAWNIRAAARNPVRAITHAPIVLPAELVDDKAWIWADLLTGSLWYYANKAAFKIQFTDAETRAMIFRYIFERGERQYLLQDSEQMKKYIEEIEQLGGKLEMRGEVDGQPYFLVIWPSTGPSRPGVAQSSQ